MNNTRVLPSVGHGPGGERRVRARSERGRRTVPFPLQSPECCRLGFQFDNISEGMTTLVATWANRWTTASDFCETENRKILVDSLS